MPMSLAAPMVVSILFCGAIFGFFYAWVCSTLWGLDRMDPRAAVEAMRAMNGSVRNLVFFPAFFLTPLATGGTAFWLWRNGAPTAAVWFLAAALIYLVGGAILTMAVNVPMNEALALGPIPQDLDAAREIWTAYSERWRFWNGVRTIASGAALACAAYGATRGMG